jgi:predicted S18 family serine protease
MALAMVSAFTNIPVHKDVAMTGEITLRGRVLPIGGLKSKILAAHLSGAKGVILPLKNQKDLIDVPDEIRKQIKLVLVESMDQVLEHALVRVPKRLEPKPAEVVEKGEELDEESPAAPDKMRRGFPGADQPPAIASGGDSPHQRDVAGARSSARRATAETSVISTRSKEAGANA